MAKLTEYTPILLTVGGRAELEALAEARGTSLSEVLREALKAEIGRELRPEQQLGSIVSQLKAMNRRLDTLSMPCDHFTSKSLNPPRRTA